VISEACRPTTVRLLWQSLKRPLEDATVEFEEERCSLAASSFRTARDQLVSADVCALDI